MSALTGCLKGFIISVLLFSVSSSSLALDRNKEHKDLLESAIAIIKREEGYSHKAYRDTACCLAIGYGRQISKDFGFNLDKYPNTTRKVEEKHLINHVSGIHELLGLKYGSVYLSLGISRKSVLISMTYQMGYTGVSKFKIMWSALGIKNYELAGDAMRNSRWFSQTKGRAMRHIETMRKG